MVVVVFHSETSSGRQPAHHLGLEVHQTSTGHIAQNVRAGEEPRLALVVIERHEGVGPAGAAIEHRRDDAGHRRRRHGMGVFRRVVEQRDPPVARHLRSGSVVDGVPGSIPRSVFGSVFSSIFSSDQQHRRRSGLHKGAPRRQHHGRQDNGGREDCDGNREAHRLGVADGRPGFQPEGDHRPLRRSHIQADGRPRDRSAAQAVDDDNPHPPTSTDIHQKPDAGGPHGATVARS